MQDYFVYIIGNDRPTLYIGVTNNLIRRGFEHKHHLTYGFTKRYGLQKLLFYEVHSDISEAILREKQLKGWRRDWKLELIASQNPDFIDLWPIIMQDSGASPE